MPRSVMTRHEVREAILSAIRAQDCEPLEAEELEISVTGAHWRPIVRRLGRLDEAQLAAVYEIGRKLGSSYDLAS
jgi:hypothetical protein